MKTTVLILLSLVAGLGILQGATATITSPTASQVINGDGITWQTTLTSTCTSGCVGIYQASYFVDGEFVGVSRTAPYSYIWNPYYVGNGVHTVYVIYADVLGGNSVTSASVAFSIENNLPQVTCATTCTDITVSIGLLAPVNQTSSPAWTSAVVSFFGSAPISIVGNVYCGRSNGATVNCPSISAGHLLAAYFRWSSGTGTLTCASNQSGTVAYGTQAANTTTGFSSQWCYVKNTGAGNTTITATVTAGTVANALAFELTTPDLTSPLDVNVVGNGPFPPIQTSAFDLTQPRANSIILAGASWNANVTASPLNGWPAANLWQDANRQSAVQAIVPPAGWFGTMNVNIVVNGPNSGISKTAVVRSDGFAVAVTNGTTAASNINLSVDTTQVLNATHAIVVNVAGGNCPSCSNGFWQNMGQWEQQIPISNAASPTYLALNYREITHCSVASTNCPTSTVITGNFVNTDGSITAATLSCTSGNTAIETISGACTTTVVGPTGSALITATSGTYTRTAWVNVMSTNVLAHFLNNGTVSTTYVPGQSVWLASSFFSSTGMNPIPTGVTSSVNYAAQFAPLYRLGFNTIEDSPSFPATSPSNFQSVQIPADITKWAGYYSTYGLFTHLIGDNYWRGSDSLYQNVYGLYANYGGTGVPAWQYAIAQYVASGLHVVGISMVDEVTGSWGGRPLAGLDTSGILIGTSYLDTPVNCTNGTTCALVTHNLTLNSALRFVMSGAVSNTNINYNTGSGHPSTYSASGNSGTITFTTPAGVGTTSYTSGTDPALQLHPYAAVTFDASNVQCQPGGSSAGPCPNWIKYDAFKVIRNQTTATAGYPGITWPSISGSGGTTAGQWCGGLSNAGTTLADYCEGYWSDGSTYLPRKKPLNGMLNGMLYAGILSNIVPAMNTQTPLIYETGGVMNDYLFHGYPITLSSCSGFTCTTTTPHAIYNVLPDQTRVIISGSTGADGFWYIKSAPTATTFTMAYANAAVTLHVNSATYSSGAVTGASGATCPVTFSGGGAATNAVGTVVTSALNTITPGAAITIPNATTGTGYTSAPTSATLSSPCGGSINVSSHLDSGGGGATITFTDGTIYSGVGLGVTANGSLPTSNQQSTMNSLGGNCPAIKTERGSLFTVANSQSAELNAGTLWLDPVGTNTTCASGNNPWRMMANVTSTGGTANIVLDNNGRRGVNWQTDSDIGPEYIFGTVTSALGHNGAGHRGYAYQPDVGLCDSTLSTATCFPNSSGNFQYFFNGTVFDGTQGPQAGMSPSINMYRSVEAFQAQATANMLASYLIPYAFQQRLPSPDYGPFYEASARTGSNGSLLMIQSYLNGSASCTADLTPIQNGNPIYRISATWAGIEPLVTLASSTTSDTMICNEAEFRAYIATATVPIQPSISARLADIANATHVLVQWSYSPLTFNTPSVLAQTPGISTYNCGSTFPCTPPWFKGSGIVPYGRLLFLDVSNKILATGAVGPF